jgi:crotonobetainyl-CoA:carnitine CoA-transferase CaiB-like acyl-CoA transferase
MVLGDLGADVIKVEDVWHGDDTRRWGPPFQGDDAAYFLSVNRNKRGLAVNLKTPEGRDIVRRLALASDIVMENFRPGTAARLGLEYGELARQNPRLIYASISGYGQTGPSAPLPGYDAVAQAVSGMMSVTGEPVRSGTSLADVGGGMWALIGILAALHAREASGQGQLVDVSLLDGQVAWLTYVAGKYFATGVTPGRHGSAHESLTPYQVLPTADAPLMVAVGSDGLWRRFAEATGLGDMADDPRRRRRSASTPTRSWPRPGSPRPRSPNFTRQAWSVKGGPPPKAARYKSLRSASRSRMLAWILTRPAIHIRAILAGVAASAITSSLFAVSLMSAGGSSVFASVTGSAPWSVNLVTNVTPRSVT